MTDKEIEKKAEELFKEKPLGFEMNPEVLIYTEGFEDGAKLMQKENDSLTVDLETLKLHDEEEIGMLQSENNRLAKHILELQKEKGILMDKLDKAKFMLWEITTTELGYEYQAVYENIKEFLAKEKLARSK